MNMNNSVVLLSILWLFVTAQNLVIKTFFGGESSYVGENTLPNATLVTPLSIAYDNRNRLIYYISKNRVHVSSNDVNTFAGNGESAYNGDNIPAPSAQLNTPSALAVDNFNNNVYIAEGYGNRIRVVNRGTNLISTLAGSGVAGYSGDGGNTTSARINLPYGLAFDNAKNLLYISDALNFCVRVVDISSGIIYTFAGDGTRGTNDNVIASSGQFKLPVGLAIDGINNLVYIADRQSNTVRVLNRTNNIISTFAGTDGVSSSTGDGFLAASATLDVPNDVYVDNTNNLIYITESSGHRIRVVNKSTSIIQTFAGNGQYLFNGDQLSPTSTNLFNPWSVSVDETNNIVYISDNSNYRIRAVQSNLISAVIGTGSETYYGDGFDITTTPARLDLCNGETVDSANNLVYITDSGNRRIRMVNRANNVISTVAGAGIFLTPNAISNIPTTSAKLGTLRNVAVDAINKAFYISDISTNIIRKVDTTTGIMTIFAGRGVSGYNGDNLAPTNTSLYNPSKVIVDSINNNVYIVDTMNNIIRVIKSNSNLMYTVAGVYYTGYTLTYNGDGINATTARLSNPNGAALDSVNNLLYIADTYNNRVRVVNLTSGLIDTYAGTGTAGFSGDGGNAKSAFLSSPTDVEMDTVNNLLFIVDTGNNAIRVVNRSTDIISSFAGVGQSSGYNGDNLLPTLGATGQPQYTPTNDNKLLLQIGETGKKALCFDPPTSIIGFQSFVLFSFPNILPSGFITGITLVPTSSILSIDLSVLFSSGGAQQLVLKSDATSSISATLQVNTEYLLMIGADNDVSYVLSQITDTKKQVIATNINYISDGSLFDSIYNDKYSICVVISSESKRNINAVNTTMLLSYYGSQKINSLSTINATSKARGSSSMLNPGAIAGIVLGVVFGVILILLLVILIITIILCSNKKQKVGIDVEMNQTTLEMREEILASKANSHPVEQYY
ncbi:NHL repeat-containing protein [Acrasis kona]|uniref:NHL repeat-containing protein n=1 Tax=Acrasis kona TaxID=1008807 RepID=A0AAW2ZR52_9EUKA